MTTTLKRWGAALLDPFSVQLYVILFSFLSEIPLIMAYVQAWKKWLLLWAALVILYDLCTRRRCFKARFSLPVWGVLIAYGITTIITFFSRREAFQETYLDFFCSGIALLVLYPPTTDDREQGMKRLSLLNWLLVVLTTLVALVALWMFAVQMGGYFHSNITDYDYPVGFANARLTGLYRNAIYPTPLIGLAVAAVEWVRLKDKAILRRILLALCVLVNALHILLANARGNTIAMAFFAGVAGLFLARRLFRGTEPCRFHWKGWLAGGACAAVVLSGVLVLAGPVRKACAYVPSLLQKPLRIEEVIVGLPGGDVIGNSTGSLLADEPVDVDRDTSSHGVLTGRPVIWKQGVGFFLKQPLFGFGPYALKEEIRVSESSTERLSHFHNIFLQSLVSVGIVGSVFFFTLLLGAAFRVLRRLLFTVEHPHYATLVMIGAMLAALLLINMADTTLFFLSKNSEFVFWTYLGYAMLLVDDAPYRLDRPVRWLDERLPRVKGF